MNIQELFTNVKANIVDIYKSEQTVRSYDRGIRNFREYLDLPDEADTSLVTPEKFIDYPTWLSGRDYAKRTIAVQIAAMKRIMKYMARENLIDFNYHQLQLMAAALEDLNRSHEDPLPKVAKNGSVNKAIQAVDTRKTWSIQRIRDKALLTFMASSGLRVSEVSTLLVGDIELETGRVYVRKGKGKKDRVTYINEEAAEHLHAYWQKRGWSEPDDPAFARHDKRLSKSKSFIDTGGLRAIVRRLAKEAGVEVTPHSFRHDFVTRIVTTTGDINLAKELAGHTTIATTQRYTHIGDDEMQRKYKKIFNEETP